MAEGFTSFPSVLTRHRGIGLEGGEGCSCLLPDLPFTPAWQGSPKA